jgi:hypothetical protein
MNSVDIMQDILNIIGELEVCLNDRMKAKTSGERFLQADMLELMAALRIKLEDLH